MEEQEIGVWMDGVKLVPASSERSDLPLLHNLGYTEHHSFTLLNHPIKINLRGNCKVTLESDSFCKRWIEEGLLDAYNNETTGAAPILESVLEVESSNLINVTFFGVAEVGTSDLEDCDLINSRLSSVHGSKNRVAKGVQFQEVVASSVGIDGPGIIADSTVFHTHFYTKEGATLEVVKSIVSESSITGGAIFLGHTELDEVWIISESNISLVQTKMENFAGKFPNISLRGKFAYFTIALPSVNLVVLKDNQSDDNFWVTAEESIELAVASNQPNDGFENWLVSVLGSDDVQNRGSIIEYVNASLASRLKTINIINAHRGGGDV